MQQALTAAERRASQQNARDICGERSKVRITLETHTLANVGVAGRRGGDDLTLSVKDTGSGMAPEIRDQLFDAYFTTKPAGKGRGWGWRRWMERSGRPTDTSSCNRCLDRAPAARWASRQRSRLAPEISRAGGAHTLSRIPNGVTVHLPIHCLA
ncbi:ATP-binding protein [Xanthomonas arboricola]|uniref:ATP-binding protein n=1 Tax=Xanthomonas arboricola TaxID=56448 RepID=UPI00215833F9|nr:ATP-binding protein [Xanthomonas arboricola]